MNKIYYASISDFTTDLAVSHIKIEDASKGILFNGEDIEFPLTIMREDVGFLSININTGEERDIVYRLSYDGIHFQDEKSSCKYVLHDNSRKFNTDGTYDISSNVECIKLVALKAIGNKLIDESIVRAIVPILTPSSMTDQELFDISQMTIASIGSTDDLLIEGDGIISRVKSASNLSSVKAVYMIVFKEENQEKSFMMRYPDVVRTKSISDLGYTDEVLNQLESII